MNVAGLFKTNIQQDTVFYTTFSDTWNQYNTVIDAIYNRSSIPLTSSVATVKLSDVATLEEKEMLSNEEIIVQKDSVVLQKLSVQYKLPTQKEIKYDIFSINTLDKKITTSDGVINTEQINSYLPTHKTRVWTLTNKNSYITSKLTTYFPDYNNIHTLTYVKLASPVEFNYGNNFKDTLFYSHLYYISSAEGHTIPYVLGYDSNGYGIAIKASDQVAYPTYLTRTDGGAQYAYKIDEFPVIPLRQAFYYAGMPVLYKAEETPNTRKITISVSEFGQLTPTTIWGDFGHSDAFASYTYYQKCYSYVGGKCTSWYLYLDENNAANKITVKNWIEPQTDILLTSDIVESAIGNYLSGPFMYGRTVVPINLIYELSRGKIYATVSSNGNIVLRYHQNTHLTEKYTDNHSLAEKAKVNSVNNINNNYNFNWGSTYCNVGQTTHYQSTINVSVPGNAILQTQNMLAKSITFTVTVTPINYSDPIDLSEECTTVESQFQSCIINGELQKCSGPGDAGNQECAQKCGTNYYCMIDNICKREDLYYTDWYWRFQENVAYLYGGIRLTKVTANISSPQGNQKVEWNTNVYYSMDKIPKEGTSFTITATLGDPDPVTLLNANPLIVKTLFDPDYNKIGDINITYDFTFQVSASAQINIYCGSVPCYNVSKHIRALSDMLRGINVNITPDINKSTFVPALTFSAHMLYNTYSFKAVPNNQLYLFTSAYTANADNLKDFTGWYTTDDLQCGSGVICSILSSNPMRDLKLYSTEYVVTKQSDARYYLSHTPAQVRNNVSNDSYYAIFHGYTPNIRLEGVPIGAGGRVSVIAKQPLTLDQINTINIQIERIMVKEKTGGAIPYQ